MLTLLAGIIMLGILVFVHELGHFAVAKWAGVKVLKFSLGFGPRLISRTWGETEYMICAVPLGGYVQMFGEAVGQEDGEKEPLTPEEKARSFAEKPVSRRTAIVAAGPLMNLILPFILLPLVYLLGVNMPAFLDAPPCIGYVLPASDGAKAGLLLGDCITAINDVPVPSWSQTNQVLIEQAGSTLDLSVRRGATQVHLQMNPANGGLEGLQSLGLLPAQEAVVGSVAPAMPAAAAGLEEGDRIVAIDQEPIDSWYDLKRVIQQSTGKPQTFAIERGAETLHLSITPVRTDNGDGEYLIGIAPQQETVFKRFGPVAAIQAGTQRGLDLIKLTLVFVQKLFAGHVSAKNIGGPITVMQIAGQAAQTDLASILSVLAFLSIQLGILNLLPIPVLDGGHLFFYLVELVFRRPLSERAREVAQQIGLLLLLLLMLLASYNDILRLFFGG